MSDETEGNDQSLYIPETYAKAGTIEHSLERKKELDRERRGKLTPQQAIFVNHFFECNCDVGQAAHRTGIKVRDANKWVEEEGPVSELIGSRLEEMAENSKVTVAAIVEKLWEEGTRMPVDTEDKTVSHAARVSALSHLAKHKGMFDKGNSGNKKQVVVNIDIGGNAPPTTIEGEVIDAD